jgi:hypothetical protein
MRQRRSSTSRDPVRVDPEDHRYMGLVLWLAASTAAAAVAPVVYLKGYSVVMLHHGINAVDRGFPGRRVTVG